MTLLEKANAILTDKNTNLKAGNLKSGVTCMGVTGTLTELQGEEITVTPTTSVQTITPSEGKNGITSVTVNAVDNTIDANILAENIKSGVTILGVTGTYTGETTTTNTTSST